MSDNNVLIQIRGDVSDINAKLADLKGYIGKVKNETKSLGEGSRASWALVSAGIASAIYSVQQISEKLQYFTDAFMSAETATMKLAVAMQNQGEYSAAALESMKDYAAQIQDTTTYEDDAVVALMANLKTYGMVNAEVQAATRTVLDFATAKRDEGMTVEAAGEIIGKAYAGQTERLKRYGIIIDENGPKTERYNAVMKQLNERFGGAAQADLETYAGRMAHLKNQLNDIAEFIGQALLKAIEAARFGLSMISLGFWTVVENLNKGLGWLTEKLADFAAFVGIKEGAENMRGLSNQIKAAGQEYTIIKEAALKMTDANYKAMVSFNNVDAAVSKMKPGKNTIWNDDEDKKAAALRQQWHDTVRDLNAAISGQGLSDFEKKIIDINKKADELREKYKDIPEAAAKINLWQQAMGDEAASEQAKKDFDDYLKKLKEEQQLQKELEAIRFKAAAEREAEINARIGALNLAEKEGTYHRDTIAERIRLTSELIRIQEQYLDTLDKAKDPASWYRQLEAIHQTRAALLGLKDEQSPVTATLRQYADEAGDISKNFAGVVKSSFRNLEDALVEGFKKGKFSFSDMIDSFITDLIRLTVQLTVTKPLAESLSQTLTGSGWSLGGFLAGLSTSSADKAGDLALDVLGQTAHTGGRVGGSYRLAFNTDFIPHRHRGGLAPNERVVINKVGERYVTEEQNTWLTSIANMMRGSSTPAAATVNNFNIYAWDSRSLEDFVKRNSGVFTGINTQALRDNKTRSEWKGLLNL